jgi:hypothetical protein
MGKEYEIAKVAGACTACGKTLQPEQEFVATVREAGEELQRQDFCPDCWGKNGGERPDVLAVWRATVPKPAEKKRRFVDDDLLINFFQRLDGSPEPTRVSFRFVLALVLMRKKLLVYDRVEKLPDGGEVWLMHFKGDAAVHRVTNPRLDDEKIAEVSRYLGDILPGAGATGEVGGLP